MAFMAANLKSFLEIKIKTRHDSYTDQISRVCVTKMFLVASLVMGVDWFHDTVGCIPPYKSSLPESFISSSCWIKGLFIFPELSRHMQDSAYYGIPADPNYDGIWNTTNELCRSDKRMSAINRILRKDCIPMERQFFTQYQWMPFCVASLSVLFYLPYLVFRVANTDLISLRLNLDRAHINADEIVKNYFNHNVNSILKMRLRLFFNLFIKLLYVAVNLTTFYALNKFLHHKFFEYGIQWIKWAHADPKVAMDFEKRTKPTPGNEMLPTFGICVIHDTRKDTTSSLSDKATMVCEISSNILYQYVFLFLWFVMIISTVSSLLGVVGFFTEHFLTMTCFNRNDESAKFVYRFLTLRECEYLEFLRRKDLTLFGYVVDALKERKMKEVNLLEDGVNGGLLNREMEDGPPPSLMYRLHSIESNI